MERLTPLPLVNPISLRYHPGRLVIRVVRVQFMNEQHTGPHTRTNLHHGRGNYVYGTNVLVVVTPPPVVRLDIVDRDRRRLIWYRNQRLRGPPLSSIQKINTSSPEYDPKQTNFFAATRADPGFLSYGANLSREDGPDLLERLDGALLTRGRLTRGLIQHYTIPCQRKTYWALAPSLDVVGRPCDKAADAIRDLRWKIRADGKSE